MGGAFANLQLPAPPMLQRFAPPDDLPSGDGTLSCSVDASAFQRAEATRKPRLLLRSPGVLSLRFADRQSLALLPFPRLPLLK
jgi:hypothetical protein